MVKSLDAIFNFDLNLPLLYHRLLLSSWCVLPNIEKSTNYHISSCLYICFSFSLGSLVVYLMKRPRGRISYLYHDIHPWHACNHSMYIIMIHSCLTCNMSQMHEFIHKWHLSIINNQLTCFTRVLGFKSSCHLFHQNPLRAWLHLQDLHRIEHHLPGLGNELPLPTSL
jgi:hypothetical protein